VNKKMFNGSLKVCVSGGGPLASDVHEFLQAGFCVKVGQGYGLTETSAASCVQCYGDARGGVVGAPTIKTDVKLVAVADIKDRAGRVYDPHDTNHLGSRCLGRGEVLMRGPMVSAGYFKQPEKTAEVYKDGWFHSGDVGVWLPDGSLQIVDRVKNLVKLIGGEYIAIEAMEIAYSTSPYVDAVKGGVMCYGDGTMDRPVILVQANTAKIASALSIENDPVEVCQSDAANKLVLQSLHEAHGRGKLGANEKVVACFLIPGVVGVPTLTPEAAWTPENGGLTASNKLNRSPIKNELDAIMQPLIAKGRK
jgi:long-chain acyl-CoA synthetase